jgi:hypothetical protein
MQVLARRMLCLFLALVSLAGPAVGLPANDWREAGHNQQTVSRNQESAGRNQQTVSRNQHTASRNLDASGHRKPEGAYNIRLSGTGEVDYLSAKANLSKAAPAGGKEIALQPGVGNHPDFSWANTAESDNFIIFWGKKIAGDPTDYGNGDLRFDPEWILETLENILVFMTDSISFIDNADTGNMSRYKHEVVMNETWTDGAFQGWAFGGWVRDGMAGGMWVHPRAAADDGLLAHELAHACQAMVMVQYPGFGLNASYAGFFWESHAEYIRAVYTGSYGASFIPRYLNTSMQHYSTTRRYYQNLYFLDFLSDTYGMEAINLIWRRANPIFSHPLTALRDLVLEYSQGDLNGDFLRHAMRNVTWDYVNGPLIRQAISQIPEARFSRDYTYLEALDDGSGTYVPPAYMAPGDYGYNIIPLVPEPGASHIDVVFKSFSNNAVGGGGNRYGFVAVNAEGKERYSEIFHGSQANASFSLLPSDAAVYLVVTGAPATHHNYGWETGFPQEHRHPYRVGMIGANPVTAGTADLFPAGLDAPAVLNHSGASAFLPPSAGPTTLVPAGAPHPNGGGWVSATASADPSAYVGPHARVLDAARISGTSRVEAHAMVTGQAVVAESAFVGGNAVVTDQARIEGEAVVSGMAIVGGNSVVDGQARVTGSARLYNSTVRDSAMAAGYAVLYRSSLTDAAVATDLAWLNWVEIGGTTLMGGNAEGYHQCKEGMYLQESVFVRTSGCDGMVDHPLNKDINPHWDFFHYPLGNIPAAPGGLQLERAGKYSISLAWNPAASQDDIAHYYVIAGGRLMELAADTTASIIGLQPGQSYDFTVRALDVQGRLSPHSEVLQVETVGRHVPDEWLSERLRVYPNPSDDQMLVEVEDGKVERLNVYDRSGRLVYEAEPGLEQVKLQKSWIGRGVFLLQVFSGKEVLTTHLMFL